MKKLLIAVISAVTLGTTIPVLAGPDWQIIEQGRKAKQAEIMKRQNGATTGMTASADKHCPRPVLVLPLSHGPRAQSTPYLNRARTERYEAQAAMCAVMAAGTGVTQ